MLFPRLRSALRYLQLGTDPVYQWKLSRSHCPSCNAHLFISLKASDFFTRCLSCRANVVNLSLIPVIKSHFDQFNCTTKHAYELSTYGATLGYLRRSFGKVTTSEYMPGEKRGEVIDGVLNEDITNLTFADNTFDVITSNSVFEHVPEDIRGYQECFRALKNDGVLIFTVPLYDIAVTIKMAAITPSGIEFIEEPEYHDSRLGGPKSALTFWRHSYRDICERVASAGFKQVELVDVIITPIQGLPTKVVYARKN